MPNSSENLLEEIKKKRIFLDKDFTVTTWDKLEYYFDELLSFEISDVNSFKHWLRKWSELEAVLEEDMAWRYIKMNLDTSNEALKNHFLDFVENIEPKISPQTDLLNKKFVQAFEKIPLEDQAFQILFKSIKNAIELYREENIPLKTKISQLEQEYGAISSLMTIEFEGEQITLQKAASYLKSNDRKLREEVYKKINNRRLEDKEKLDNLLLELIQLRQKVAKNASFENYRDYKFKELNRFDYTPADCYDFHQAIKENVIPVINQFHLERKKSLGIDEIFPYDLEVDEKYRSKLEPFKTSEELIDKTITCFDELDPYFSNCLQTMKEQGYLDLESKKGKAPGGFNYPLYESNIPFIYMNAVGSQSDLVTMVHEGGHAIHSFLSGDLEYTFFKSFPSEIAELASMSMELISMDSWKIFYNDEENLKRAKKDLLERAISVLPWVAIVDKFQHELYVKDVQTADEIYKIWENIYNDFSSEIISWKGLENYKQSAWQKQLHIYEVPFYYIEYGMAQLGAISIWKNYIDNPFSTLNSYKEALKLGYTQNIKSVYKTAGIEFDFTKNNIKNLMNFLMKEINNYK
jgi:oligoendopeptidase F